MEPLSFVTQKKPKRFLFGQVFIILNAQGQWLIVKNTEKKLLEGLYAFPSNTWSENIPSDIEAPFLGHWIPFEQKIRHVFSHFTLELSVFACIQKIEHVEEGIWVDERTLHHYPMSTLMHKVLKAQQSFFTKDRKALRPAS
jgi:A/G-specific adenine glycosylase